MKKFLVLFATFFILSCSEQVFEPPIDVGGNDFIEEEVMQTDSLKVNSQEVAKVVESILGLAQTRSNTQTTDIIKDEDGNPLIYVVNNGDNDGFVLVSATKNIVPILAYNKEGHFNVNGFMPNGLKAWKTNALNTIIHSDTLSYQAKHFSRMLWKKHEQDLGMSEFSRSADLPVDYNELRIIVENSRSQLARKGYITYSVDDRYISGNQSLDEEMRNYIREGIHPEYEDYWNAFSFIAMNPNPKVDKQMDNFVESEWKQDQNYNARCPMINNQFTKVGCGVLSVGQVMRYYQYPTSFNWENMPHTYPTLTTANFLSDLGLRCNAQYGLDFTITYLSDCKSALESYGYTANIADYDEMRTINDIMKQQPVIMRADTEGVGIGHAWVASGCDYKYYDPPRYEIWTFISRTEFKEAYCFIDGYPRLNSYLYMNWGYGRDVNNDTYNGYYNTSGLQMPTQPGNLVNRRNIYDIKPNN